MVCGGLDGLLVLVETTGLFGDLCPPLWAGIPEDSKVEGPAFTDAIRMYRQSKELYGTWEMLCGNEVQVRLEGPRGPRSVGWEQRGALGTAGLERDDKLRVGQVGAGAVGGIVVYLFVCLWCWG